MHRVIRARGLRESRVPGRPTLVSLLQYRARTKWQHRARARRSASCHHPCRRRSGRVNFPYGASTLYIPYYSVVAWFLAPLGCASSGEYEYFCLSAFGATQLRK
ncbi:hypothetical protein J6590_105296 [Homalodisca vitripennis]|nr:hypothetical protein J6590_105296 [Homalodisca vitripennis]